MINFFLSGLQETMLMVLMVAWMISLHL